MSKMDKLTGLKEILMLDPKSSLARYGLAVELAGRGEIDEALHEFDTLLANDPDYTAGYFMSAQTLSNGGAKRRGHRASEGRDRLRGPQRQPPCAERDAGHA